MIHKLPARILWVSLVPLCAGLSSYSRAGEPGPTPAAAVAPATAVRSSTSPFVPPEITTAVMVSAKDINRVQCDGALMDYFWSVERPVTVSHSENNVFVKFKIERLGEHDTYASEPVDLHVICSSGVYTMILYPKPIDSTTVRLGNPQAKQADALASGWNHLPLEEQIQRFTLAVYKQALPDGFKAAPIAPDAPNHTVDLYSDLSITASYTVTAPGTGLKATEYLLRPSHDVQLRENAFVRSEFGAQILAITINPLTVHAGESARMIVIQRSAGNGW